ncbi:uncharacterized protein LOC135424417 [Pseudopipra pipra]|uniref:uncharacterized protein LOC135424417 n=1 Tax=Pseudopipra pipra TaxID=415032 RepID=UPI0031387EE7
MPPHRPTASQHSFPGFRLVLAVSAATTGLSTQHHGLFGELQGFPCVGCSCCPQAHTTKDVEKLTSTSLDTASLPGPRGGGRGAARLGRRGWSCGAARRGRAGGRAAAGLCGRRPPEGTIPRRSPLRQGVRLPGESLPPPAEPGGHPPCSCGNPSPARLGHPSFAAVRCRPPAPGSVCTNYAFQRVPSVFSRRGGPRRRECHCLHRLRLCWSLGGDPAQGSYADTRTLPMGLLLALDARFVWKLWKTGA